MNSDRIGKFEAICLMVIIIINVVIKETPLISIYGI